MKTLITTQCVHTQCVRPAVCHPALRNGSEHIRGRSLPSSPIGDNQTAVITHFTTEYRAREDPAWLFTEECERPSANRTSNFLCYKEQRVVSVPAKSPGFGNCYLHWQPFQQGPRYKSRVTYYTTSMISCLLSRPRLAQQAAPTATVACVGTTALQDITQSCPCWLDS